MKKVVAPKPPGFTLVEMLVSSAVIIMVIALGSPYLFKVHQKSLLSRETIQLVSQLEYARQESLAAKDGQGYGVNLALPFPTRTFELIPSGKVFTLSRGVNITDGPTIPINFQKITGHLIPKNTEHTLRLEYKNFYTTVTIGKIGLINFSPPEPF